MKEVFMDGRNWKDKDDVYDSFFQAVGAPSWHGRNFDALNDSIGAGAINRIEVPYRLVIQNYDLIQEGARKMIGDFIALIHELKDRGCEVDVRVENSTPVPKSPA
jgi:RNAse (barnase) inhibitor barstar